MDVEKLSKTKRLSEQKSSRLYAATPASIVGDFLHSFSSRTILLAPFYLDGCSSICDVLSSRKASSLLTWRDVIDMIARNFSLILTMCLHIFFFPFYGK